jgi:hypothetical protein
VKPSPVGKGKRKHGRGNREEEREKSITALSLGERVARDGAFTSRRGPGEGSLARINRASQKSKRKRQIAKVAIARTFDF